MSREVRNEFPASLLLLSPNYLVALGLVFFLAFRQLHVAHRTCIKLVGFATHATVDYLERTAANHLRHLMFAGLAAK
jgi:hypothetical protein